jgi:prepilin-type N-terminal cleavage/methylation domain-containing protein
MRQAFTLIELMIVIAIIAIIAAIAIPNLLESRITANESAAAASLKSGIFPAEVQFQAGAYSDVDSNGRGEYCNDVKYFAGIVNTEVATGNSPKALNLVAPTFTVGDNAAVGAYLYQVDVATIGSTVAGDQQFGENFFAAYAAPNNPGNDGRRSFGVNSFGSVFATKQTLAATTDTIGLSKISWAAPTITASTGVGNAPTATAGTAGASKIFFTDPTITNSVAATANASPYVK